MEDKIKLIDEIYGEEVVEEPVLIELISSPEMQRLKGISMQGPPQDYWHSRIFSRYEHSIGVFILLKKLGSSLEEQIAGLLHDVSHTAFSHIIDWVVGDSTREDFQDNIHLERIEKSAIKDILEKYGFDYKRIADFSNFSLLDKEIPEICIDRFDYSIREIKDDLGLEKAKKIFLSLKNVGNNLVFFDVDLALEFSRGFKLRQELHWGSEESKKKYYLFSKIFKRALEKNILVFEDFWTTDCEVLVKLIDSGDLEIIENLKLMKRKDFLEKFESLDFKLEKKNRFVNPDVLVNGEIKKLSEVVGRKRLRIAIDIDEVLVPHAKDYLEFHNKKFGTNFDFESFGNFKYWEILGFSLEEIQVLFKEFSEVYNFPPFENSQRVISTLAKSHDLFIITSRPLEVKELTLDFLDNNFGNCFNQVLFSGDNNGELKIKSDLCIDLGIDIIIEDSPVIAQKCLDRGVQVFLFDQPWNRELSGENFIRVYNWEDILNKLKEIENGIK